MKYCIGLKSPRRLRLHGGGRRGANPRTQRVSAVHIYIALQEFLTGAQVLGQIVEETGSEKKIGSAFKATANSLSNTHLQLKGAHFYPSHCSYFFCIPFILHELTCIKICCSVTMALKALVFLFFFFQNHPLWLMRLSV